MSADEIVDRAARKAESWRYICLWCAAVCFTITVGLSLPVHTWLHGHSQFLGGLVVGTWAELALCERWPQRTAGWLRDRWRWMKWFSHQ